jgi:hypothetical protein
MKKINNKTGQRPVHQITNFQKKLLFERSGHKIIAEAERSEVTVVLAVPAAMIAFFRPAIL